MMIPRRALLIITFTFLAIVCIQLVSGGGVPVFADEGGSGGTRSLYDTIMLFVNFFILAGVIIKFGKEPIMNALHRRKEELARQIQKLEEERDAALKKNREAMEMVEAGEAYIAKIKDRVKAQGLKEKERLIEDAKKQSQYMLENAKRRTESYIGYARQEFRAELIDAAMDLATKRLPQIITDKDRQGLVDAFIEEAF